MIQQPILHAELLSLTDSAEDVVYTAAKTCYSELLPYQITPLSSEERDAFIKKVLGFGHHSIMEHVAFTFGISGISRACSHQLVRHRIASYSQQSQRYVAFDSPQVIIPQSIKNIPKALDKYTKIAETIFDAYHDFLELGIPAEDARFLLPNACPTNLVMTMNGRELLHFFNLRCCNRAQWEIRALAKEMLLEVQASSPVFFNSAGPSCVTDICKEGSMTCGKSKEVREEFFNMKKVQDEFFETPKLECKSETLADTDN